MRTSRGKTTSPIPSMSSSSCVGDPRPRSLSLGEAGEAARRDAAGEGDRDESGDAL